MLWDIISHISIFNLSYCGFLKILLQLNVKISVLVKYRKSIEIVSKKYRKVLGIGIGFFGDTDTLKLTRYPILRVLGIGFVPSLIVTIYMYV